MATPEILTYHDTINACVDFLSGHTGVGAQRDIRRGILAAYRQMAAETSDSYRQTRGRLHLVAPYTAGACYYTHSTLTVTLTDPDSESAAWPSWAADATIKIGNVVCDVASRTSDTEIVLDSVRNFGEDIGTITTDEKSYTLYKTCYHLPRDYAAASGFLPEPSSALGELVTLDEYFQLERYGSCSSEPRKYAVGGVQDTYGMMGLYVWPAPTANTTFDFMYERMPRNLRYSGHDSRDSGSVTGNVAGTAFSDSNGSFTDAMVGSVIRVSDTTTAPTGVDGTNPYLEERIISSVTNSTTLVLDSTGTTGSNIAYIITDPVDLDRPFWEAFMARCYYEIAVIRNMDSKADLFGIYKDKMLWAKCNAKKVVRPPTGVLGPIERKYTVVDHDSMS